jgi:hypothetical protein
MLQNEYLVAKVGVDTAENEPPKVHESPFKKILVNTLQNGGDSNYCSRHTIWDSSTFATYDKRFSMAYLKSASIILWAKIVSHG